jgi:hypothetical protein
MKGDAHARLHFVHFHNLSGRFANINLITNSSRTEERRTEILVLFKLHLGTTRVRLFTINKSGLISTSPRRINSRETQHAQSITLPGEAPQNYCDRRPLHSQFLVCSIILTTKSRWYRLSILPRY